MTDITVDTSFIEPEYGTRSLSDVLPAVAAALGVGAADATGLELPDASSYVVFLVDGMGHHLLRRYAHVAPFLSAHLGGATATAGVPSTTATSLTSLGTGLPPGAHGVLGYTTRVPGTDRLLNALAWDKRVDPVDWQPSETAFRRLADAGVTARVVNKREFRDSGLTTAAQRGAEYVGADRPGERIAGVIESAAIRSSVTYAYDGDLDWTGHRYGVASTAWLQQLAVIDAELEQLREALPAHARLLVVADHGMVDCPQDSRVDVSAVPELTDGVTLVGGEARFRHVYCRPGAVADVVATWRALLAGRATVLERSEAVARGWFGTPAAGMLPRIGDVVAAAEGDTAILATGTFPYEAVMVGMHGSLTAEEMLIPILVI